MAGGYTPEDPTATASGVVRGVLRAYADPTLLYPLGRSGTWKTALEMPCARGQQRTKRVYIHNPTGVGVLIKPIAQGVAGDFSVVLPESIQLAPGVTPMDIQLSVGGSAVLPSALDFSIVSIATTNDPSGRAPYSDMAYSGTDYTQSSSPPASASLRFEVTAFALASADERFGDLGDTSPLRNTRGFTDYLASAMGYADGAYRALIVDFMSDRLFDIALWAVNKHHFFNPVVAPMRVADVHAQSIGYRPPSVAGLPPAIRRRVYARAWDLARNVGSAQGIRGIFEAIGVPKPEISIWRSGFVWEVRVPQWVVGAYGLDYLGNLALYHVDAYTVINMGDQANTVEGSYSGFDYTVGPAASISSGMLILEDGVSYLLLEDGTKIKLEN